MTQAIQTLRQNEIMTKQERIDAVFEKQLPDRVPIIDKLRNNRVIEYYTGKKLTQDNKFEVVTEAIARTLDIVSDAVRFPHISETQADKDGFVWDYQEWTEWIQRRPFRDVLGARDFVKQKIKELKKGYSEQNPSWKTQKSIEEIKKLRNRINQTVIAISSNVGLDAAYHLIGMENFVYLYHDDPCLISEWLELLCKKQVRRAYYIGPLAEFSYVTVFSDISSNVGLIFSPSFLEKEFFPRLAKVVEAWNENGYTCFFHSDGNLNAIINDLIDSGIKGLHPIEVSAGMDIGEIKNKYGDKLVLLGGIDCSGLLPNGTPTQVRQAVRKAIQIAGQNGGYVIGSTSELHNAIPPENIIAMFRTVWEYGTYPLNLDWV